MQMIHIPQCTFRKEMCTILMVLHLTWPSEGWVLRGTCCLSSPVISLVVTTRNVSVHKVFAIVSTEYHILRSNSPQCVVFRYLNILFWLCTRVLFYLTDVDTRVEWEDEVSLGTWPAYKGCTHRAEDKVAADHTIRVTTGLASAQDSLASAIAWSYSTLWFI